MISVPDALERALSLSKADACITIGRVDSSTNVRWANNTSTTNGFVPERSLTMISIKDRSPGVVSTDRFDEDSIEGVVRRSESACEGRPPAHDYTELPAGDGTSNGWGEEYEETPPAALGEFAAGLAKVFERAGADGFNLFGFAAQNAPALYLATSTGVRRRFRRSWGVGEFTAKTPDFLRSAYARAPAANLSQVSPDVLYGHLATRLGWAGRSISLDPGRYEVILEPQAVAEMLLYLYWSSTAREADEGRSAFSKPGGGNLSGEKMYPEFVSLYSDPSEEGATSAPFVAASSSSSYSSLFDNGLAFSRIDWVREGVLKTLITPKYWAEQTGAAPAPFAGNLIFPGVLGGPGIDSMIASTDRALLVTRFWYIRMLDPQTLLLTGLTRDGVFLVEDGEVKGAVNNFRFNMSPIAMLRNAVEAGEARLVFQNPAIKAPPLRVRDFHMSSVSEAT